MMSELNQVAEAPTPPQAPRWGTIELSQVFSVLALAASYFLYRQAMTGYFRIALALGLILFLVPFLLVRLPDRESEHSRLPEGPHGFKITRERRRTLAQFSLPADILGAIDESLLDIDYKTGKELREALYVLLGEARVRPWLGIILLHSRVYRPTPEAKTGDDSIGAASLVLQTPTQRV